MDKPFFSVDQKSGVELTKLAEAGNVDPSNRLSPTKRESSPRCTAPS